jgi:GntR family transcriptional regulator, transcriptional repressor for pyruvate dehydrogenase complex
MVWSVSDAVPRIEGFRRLGQRRIHESVAEQIRRHIALHLVQRGRLLPPERELAGIFGVSRATIQQAIEILEAEHLVESRRGRKGGTFVVGELDRRESERRAVDAATASRTQIEDALTYRQVIEPAAAALAAGSRSDSDLASLGQAVEGMRAADSDPTFMRWDTAFHLGVGRATHNAFFEQAAEEIRLALNPVTLLLPASTWWDESQVEEHRAIDLAIVSGDSRTAGKLMHQHVADAERAMRAVLALL